MQSRSVAFLFAVIVLTGLSIWGYLAKPFEYGLDVRGGVRLTYKIDPNTVTAEQRQRIASIQDDLVKIMESRSSAALGVVEGSVAKKGDDQLVVELPGFTNIESARSTLGTTAKIQVYHARNVSSPIRQRIYERAGEEMVGGAPIVTFSRKTSPNDVLKPGTPGYASMIEGWSLILEGGDVKDAYPMQLADRTVPEFKFSDEGGRKMETFTRRYKQENIAFVLDGKVLNIAPVKEGTILKEGAYVDGTFDPAYVRSLTNLIKAGSLPVGLIEQSSLKVDPTIGTRALTDIVTAGLVSFGLVIIFLMVYYGFPGVVASLALILYALFTITALKLFNATFSLAAIAGFILSVSMAVDANILIFERLKEEVRAGRSLLTAIELAFKRALSAIVDSNAATIATSIVLFALGTSVVKGFATTLIVGVLISFFTAVVVTRFIITGLTGVGIGTNLNWYALHRNWFGEHLEREAETKPLKIIEKRNIYFMISGGIMLFGLAFVAMGGIRPNVEFQGGYEAVFQVPSSQSLTPAGMMARLHENGIKQANIKFGEGRAKTGEATKLVYVTVPLDGGLPNDQKQAEAALAKATGLSLETGAVEKIGPSVRQETVNNALLGIIISTSLIIIWLAARFGVALGGFRNGVKFGMSAAAAMLHDIIVVFGVAGVVGFLFGWEISALFITAMLTVASFSVHDTIVIFDRIRENLRRPHRGQTFEFLVNKSITQTVARSINTSMTAIVTLILLIIIGTPTPELKFMCVAMLSGMIIGTYSSIFNAAPILYLWDAAIVKGKGAGHGLMAESERELKLRATTAQIQGGAAPEAGYGTIKRRQTAASKATKPLDDED